MDNYTDTHMERVEWLIEMFAKALGISREGINELRIFARIHDIGKIRVPRAILFKPDKLTDEEMSIMRTHSEHGQDIIKKISEWIAQHHEWWNGEGYPHQLSGEDIPIECRILAIIDAYDAMTSDRPYRRSLGHEEAMKEIERCSGQQFDPQLVDIFLELFREYNEGIDTVHETT